MRKRSSARPNGRREEAEARELAARLKDRVIIVRAKAGRGTPLRLHNGQDIAQAIERNWDSKWTNAR